jgi:hypothetical protein
MPAFSKKHYEAIASILKDQRDAILERYGEGFTPEEMFVASREWKGQVGRFVVAFHEDNHLFDGERFCLAAGTTFRDVLRAA